MFICAYSSAQSIEQSVGNSFLRWKISASKNSIKIKKEGNDLIIQSLDADFFNRFSGEVAKLNLNNNYHSKLKFNAPKMAGGTYSMDVELKDESIELFSFYKNDENSYILDFWVNQDTVATKNAAAATPKIKLAKLNSTKKAPKKIIKKKPVTVAKAFTPKNNKRDLVSPQKIKQKVKEENFRDFRYGAAFIWDYKAQIPPIEQDISLNEKAPDYFYEVKDRVLLDDKKEAHMQLSINFFKKEDWGLMTRSINLYEEKYGSDKNKFINDFMKATSMIKNTIKSSVNPEYTSQLGAEGEVLPAEDYSTKGVRAAARNLLTNIVEASDEYALSKAVLRYLIQFYRNENDHIQALGFAKNLYVKASEDFDDDMIIYSSRVILNSLANLRQIDKMKTFLENKAVKRVLPAQEGLAYISFVNLFEDKASQVLADFTVNKDSLASPIHPSILYNTAEAYFRKADYRKAIKLYDDFLDKYSFLPESSQARLRIALSYDLLEADLKKVLKLYKDAINKSGNLAIRFEAKLRYVGLRVARNRRPSDADLETIVFINAQDAEKPLIKDELKHLLWLTRLRTFIVTKKYNDAIAYLTSLPTETLRPVEQRTFHADGAEIVLGLIQSAYIKGDYATAVKVWEIYKNKYEDKVGESAYLNFIVSDSFVNLRLFDSYKRAVAHLEKLKGNRTREYPLWVETNKDISTSDYIVELNMSYLLEQDNYKELEQFLELNKTNKNINYNFYKALVSYHNKKYNEAVTSTEVLLVSPNANNNLTPGQNKRMLEAYLESLYEISPAKKFREKTAALIVDLQRNNQNNDLDKMISRADYLYIESLYSEKNPDFKILGMKAEEFLTSYSDNEYNPRVTYLNGIAKVKSSQQEAGKEILQKLLDDNKTPDYLKGLARSELTSLKLKEKTL